MVCYVTDVRSVPAVIFHVPGVFQITGAQATEKSVSLMFLSPEDM